MGAWLTANRAIKIHTRGNFIKEASYTRDVGDNTTFPVTHDMYARQQTYEAERKLNKRLSLNTAVTPHDRDTTARKLRASTTVGVNITLNHADDGEEKKKKM
jgi:hypothetical protein